MQVLVCEMIKSTQSMQRIIILISLVIIFLSINSIALAQDHEPNTPSDDEVNAIARKMYCPVCENTPLDVCPTQACNEWRELIRLKLSEDWSEQEIMDYFVDQYGYRVLAEPPTEGFNWLIYLVPPIAFVVGVFFLIRVIQGMKTSKYSSNQIDLESKKKDSSFEDEEYFKRIEDKLRNL
jgi:cytochrome c-type biogenesis protein CcmH